MRISDWSSDVCSSDLESLTSAQAQSIEPELRCTAALFSPSTGIIDSHAYMLALQGEAEAHGVLTALGVRLSAITLAGPGLRLSFAGDPDPALEARLVINAAGHGAQALEIGRAWRRERAFPFVFISVVAG